MKNSGTGGIRESIVVSVTCDWLARIPAFFFEYTYSNLEYGTNTLSLNVGGQYPRRKASPIAELQQLILCVMTHHLAEMKA
jgi:hypothetical protein